MLRVLSRGKRLLKEEALAPAATRRLDHQHFLLIVTAEREQGTGVQLNIVSVDLNRCSIRSSLYIKAAEINRHRTVCGNLDLSPFERQVIQLQLDRHADIVRTEVADLGSQLTGVLLRVHYVVACHFGNGYIGRFGVSDIRYFQLDVRREFRGARSVPPGGLEIRHEMDP